MHLMNCVTEYLVSSPILAYPDYERCFILDTDASDVGIGAELSQVSGCGSECAITYASRSLSRQEQRYCVTRKESVISSCGVCTSFQTLSTMYSGENSLFELSTDLWSGYGISMNRKVN